MPSTLPSQRHLLTTLLTQLSSPTPSSSPSDRRHLLLTLHVIFPHLLLAALDLLDRRLVTRLTLQPPASASTSNNDDNSDKQAREVFVVRSLASTRFRRRGADDDDGTAATGARSYLVRLGAWNCSCAGFAYEAFPTRAGAAEEEHAVMDALAGQGAGEWSFGGLSRDGKGALADAVPCCKHLLACLLAERCGQGLEYAPQTRFVTKEELAEVVADT
ncbi:hypothetical protein S7711_02047 [Stachybotrys chartarum IBT 7711]|uniref:SWIM-type domain-containing protein n=1 Tax=Stachybotrys chartarum (strain CBS 109288 / IBT 7711) TaxID=1280523 RepID=A0A084AW31_STACB|nr:hypothetical protein S7711_02047 [Stachybotrys chartarum IBT 7711]KFA53273.1 hypothetical protein S40293_04693 [Stachybotrys chartarum IBT 40293]KFA78255.1 hypothetical protein S40288_02632 [Stachybotrys chartarum IBT 40288]